MPSLQLSDPISSFPAEQAKSPAELGLKKFVVYKVCHINCSTNVKPAMIREIDKSTRNQRQIDEK